MSSSLYQQAQDFAGVWKCSHVEGMEELLAALNVSWLKRKAGAAMGFGAKRVVQTVTQIGDKIAIVNSGGIKDFTNEIEAICPACMDGPVRCAASWGADGSLVLRTQMKGTDVVIVRRRVDATTTVVEVTCGNVVSVRTFALVSAA
ncbi:hypothetical protein ACHHYP_01551 [Achlya hypogyna]|uniref:Uncharacterized protein n=1 Tax=Achlya hypogyna TaxID=1202772 RepID=A0A1V9Z8C9_ACHHY|nr:hypothetical protein ACHHYP_01551 [Achlya hypogyna]